MAQQKTLLIRFLNELHSEEVKSTFEFLTTILEGLEDKNDPERIEMEIVDSSYQVIEKLSVLESLIRKYIKEDNDKNLAGNMLSELYER